MNKSEYKILAKLISEGYKLKQQHSNKVWKKALEDAEELAIEWKRTNKRFQVLRTNPLEAPEVLTSYDSLVELGEHYKDAQEHSIKTSGNAMTFDNVFVVDTKNGDPVEYKEISLYEVVEVFMEGECPEDLDFF